MTTTGTVALGGPAGGPGLAAGGPRPATSAPRAGGVARRAGRWLRIVGRVSLLNLRARLQYRGEFLLGVVSGVLWQTSVLAFAGVLLTRFPTVGAWPAGAVLLIASLRLFAHAGYVLGFVNLIKMPYLVREGRMDGYLVRPMSTYTQVLISSFNPNALGDLAAAVLLFVPAVHRLHLHWRPATVLLLAGVLAGGVLLEAAVQTAIACLSIRSAGTDALAVWVDTVLATFGNYPLDVFPKVLRLALTYLLPVAFIAYVPAATLLGDPGLAGVPPAVGVLCPAVGLGAWLAARLLWRLALRSYQSPAG